MNEENKKITSEENNLGFSYNENKLNIKISFERIAFIFFVFFIVAIIFSSKVILLSLEKKEFKIKISKIENFRSSIIDKKAILESLMSFKRAGASAIVSYYADRISSFLNY